MNINALISRSHELSRAKGWYDADAPRATTGDKLMMVVTEYAEAIEDFRAGHGMEEIWFAKGPRIGLSTDLNEEDMSVYLATACDGHKPCGIPIELADAVIRLCDFAGWLGAGTEETRTVEDFAEGHSVAYVESPDRSFLERLLALTSMVTEFQFSGSLNSCTAFSAIVDGAVCLIGHTLRVAELHDVPIEAAIEIKHAYNMTRPHRHGGKKV